MERVRAILGVLLWSLAAAGCAPAPETDLEPELWAVYAARFVTAEGRVVDTGQGGITTSEGQGFAMLLAEAAGERDGFERLWTWTRRALDVREDGLLAWQWREGEGVVDANNATDGDLLVAWALARAAGRWGEPAYAEAAAAIARAVRGGVVVESAVGPVLLPGREGFVHGEALTVNPSYWVFPAFTALDRVDPHPLWGRLAGSGDRLLAHARYTVAGLPADWLEIEGERIALATRKPPRFGFEAVRVPLYALWSGRDPRASPHLGVAAFLGGPRAAGWLDLRTEARAGFPPTPGQLAVSRLILDCIGGSSRPVPAGLPADYYDASLVLLARVARHHCGAAPA